MPNKILENVSKIKTSTKSSEVQEMQILRPFFQKFRKKSAFQRGSRPFAFFGAKQKSKKYLSLDFVELEADPGI